MTTLGPHRFEHEAMATSFEVFVAGRESDYARSLATAIFAEVDRLEGLLSRYDPCSDVGRINALRPGQTIRVGGDVLDCLMVAAKVWQDTAGIFDVTVGPLVECWRDVSGRPRSPGADELDAARRRTGMDRLILNPVDFTVSLVADGRGPALVDLGGIGKGFALDRAAELLDDWGVTDALLQGGTSTALALGSERPGTEPGAGECGWRVGVGGRWGQAAGFESIRLCDAALSGSGPDVKGEHIIDPRHGRPGRQHEASWVRCPSATLADALSTAFILMPEAAIKGYCEAHPQVEAFVVPCGSESGLTYLAGPKG